jgi:hypothetical protein
VTNGRRLAGIVLAVVAGVALAWLDTRPGYDDTGVTAVGLAVAAGIAVLVEGSGRILWATALAVAVGIWIPLLEIAPPGSVGSLLALVFTAGGAALGWAILRGVAGSTSGLPRPR